MERFGFYARPPLDYPAGQRYVSGVFTSRGLTPVSSNQVDVGRVAIGQGGLLATPLQMAMVAAAVANGGTLVKPHLTDRIVDPDGRVSDDIGTSTYHRVMSGDTASKLTQMMANVVKEGTGTAAALSGIEVAGKTGTAEVENGATNQVWFIGFAPRQDPKVAVAATVERSDGFGGTVAAPIAKQVMETLLNQ
jgi:peptidoglycan glycosyltransferase